MSRLIAMFAGVCALSVAAAAAPVSAAPSLGQVLADRAAVGPAVAEVGSDTLSQHSVAFPGGVTGLPDLTYATLNGYRPLKMDLFLPPASFAQKGPRPFVVFVHGGGWSGGGPRRSSAYSDWPVVLASLAERGYVVATVSYRFSGEAPFPAAIKDVKASIRYLRANAALYHIDVKRGAIWGASAGGHLAGLAAVSCGAAGLSPDPRVVPKVAGVELAASQAEGADAQSDCVQAAVTWFGIFDFSTMPSRANDPARSAEAVFLGCATNVCTPAQMGPASPVTYVSAKAPPMLVMHGAEDKLVPHAQSEQFVKALTAAGAKAELVILPGVGHSWLGATPEATIHASKEALQRSIDFIDAQIGDRAP